MPQGEPFAGDSRLRLHAVGFGAQGVFAGIGEREVAAQPAVDGLVAGADDKAVALQSVECRIERADLQFHPTGGDLVGLFDDRVPVASSTGEHREDRQRGFAQLLCRHESVIFRRMEYGKYRTTSIPVVRERGTPGNPR